jgi:tetratricopeptide (TPR) repeat protein
MFFVVLVLIELVFFEGKGLSRSQKYFLFLLLSLVPIYLLVFSIGVCLSADKVFAFRGYSFEERMLFFPASLLNYASGALSIDLRVPSVFHDDFLVRQRGLSAAVHVFNWAALVALIGFVWRNRRAAKLFAVGGFGFVALHYLEGMPTPIEPYFSHRNYLPSAFMLIACCSGLLLFLKSFKNVRVVFLTSVFSYFCFVSAIAALTWGNTFSLAYSWSIQYPDSLRAQRYYADELSRLGSPANSLKVDFYSAQRFPEALGPVINAIRSQCKIGGDLTEGLQELNRRVGAFNLTRGDVLTVNSTLRNIEAMGGGKCFVTEVEKQLFFGFLEQYAGVEIFRRYKRLGADMNFIKGLFHAQVGDLASAIGALDEADMLMPSVDIMMYRANWLMTAGLKELALEALDIAIERDRLLNGAGASRLEELRLMRARYEQY